MTTKLDFKMEPELEHYTRRNDSIYGEKQTWLDKYRNLLIM